MLDDVAIYLVAAPVVITAGIIGATLIWLTRQRLASIRVAHKRRQPQI